jgi:hypothetical protein
MSKVKGNPKKKFKYSNKKKAKGGRGNRSLIKQSQVMRSPTRSSIRKSKKKNLSQSVNNSHVKDKKKSMKLRFLKG